MNTKEGLAGTSSRALVLARRQEPQCTCGPEEIECEPGPERVTSVSFEPTRDSHPQQGSFSQHAYPTSQHAYPTSQHAYPSSQHAYPTPQHAYPTPQYAYGHEQPYQQWGPPHGFVPNPSQYHCFSNGVADASYYATPPPPSMFPCPCSEWHPQHFAPNPVFSEPQYTSAPPAQAGKPVDKIKQRRNQLDYEDLRAKKDTLAQRKNHAIARKKPGETRKSKVELDIDNDIKALTVEIDALRARPELNFDRTLRPKVFNLRLDIGDL